MGAQAVLSALASVLLLAAAYFLAKSQKAAAAAAPAAPAGAAPTYYIPQAAGAYWPAEISGQYACAGTINPNWCTFADAASGQAACSPDPACLGYVVAGNTGWSGGSLPGSAVMLVSRPPTAAPPAATPKGNVFYKKVAP